MPAPRTKRVPADFGKAVLMRLDRAGDLEVLLGMLWDHEDYLREQITRKLMVPLTGDPAALAALQADQGALREIAKVATAWQTLARAPEPAHAMPKGEGRAVVEGLTQKRVRARF